MEAGVARMSEATSGFSFPLIPASRSAHAGYLLAEKERVPVGLAALTKTFRNP
jgi:hypothetical protein